MKIEELSLNESVANIKVELQKTKIKMSGKNKVVGFNYFELADFLPTLNELLLKYKVNDNFTITTDTTFGTDYAILTLIKGEEKQEYRMPFKLFDTPLNTVISKITGEAEKKKCMQDIQYLGALNTYYKRYLYMNAFGITDGEVIDGMNNNELDGETNSKTTKRKATEGQVKMLAKYYKDDNLTKLLETNKIKKLEDMDFDVAKNLIAQIVKKSQENKEAKENE